MKDFYVHPIVDNHIWVTCVATRGNKQYRYIAFQVDLPGRWCEEDYNCHVDGCDYQFKTLEQALRHGANYFSEPYRFIETEEKFNIFGDNRLWI